MTIGVYGIFDVRDDTCLYVGQSRIIEERWKGHLKRLRLGKHLRPEFNDYFLQIDKDESLLEFRILEECEDIDAIKNIAEIRWFNLLAPKFYGKHPTVNEKWTHSDETKARIARANVETARKRLGDDYVMGGRLYDLKCNFCGSGFRSLNETAKCCSVTCGRANWVKPIDDAEVSRQYLAGASMTEIAENQGITQPGVQKSLHRSGTKIRTRSEGLRLKAERGRTLTNC